MFQNTVLRLQEFADTKPPIALCNETHRFMVAEQLRKLDIQPEAIILEPVGRNTAPAIAVASFQALKTEDTPVLLVLPADHHIEDNLQIRQAVAAGQRLASQGRLVTFGIVPSHPETGYGYIKKGGSLLIPGEETGSEAYVIDRFVEKPDQETARHYFDSGQYCWNSGMFMFRADVYLRELKQNAPEMVEACQQALETAHKDMDFLRLNKDWFLKCPNNSVDYAVMESTDKGAMIPLEAGWSDLGSWNALWEVKDKDETGNVILGDVWTHEVKGTYLHATSRLVAAVGVEDQVVVETSDAVLVASKDKVQDIKHLVNRLKASSRYEAVTHSKVYRPWGSYETISFEPRFQVKRITVKPGSRLSLQKHYHRAEHWVVVKGTAKITNGESEMILSEDQSTYIPLGTVHRLENPGCIPLELIEIQTGSYLGEDDIVRITDDYGRLES
jgi:mannose-1-phosphate guanylyltransferase/mannose-1-phosphate guanylyltransferase/mannose-6-phosphate isomerase